MTHIKKLFFVLSILIFSCSEVKKIKDEAVFGDGNENWIQDKRKLPIADSLFYSDEPAPLFRKEFTINNSIKSAKLYITSAGYYITTINEKRVGKNILDPAWTDYTKKIYYSEYDVTSYVKNGNNCIGVSLGNGFYNPLPLKMWGRINLRKETNVGKPAFISKLLITYNDGESEEIVSDNTWKYALGPIIKNSVYLGVAYDANKEVEHWNVAGYDDKLWENATISPSPGGKLEKAFFPPVQVIREITPNKIYSPEPDIWIVDMGINFTGTYKMKISGKKGDTITFRFGERIYENG